MTRPASHAPRDPTVERLAFPVLCLARDASITVVENARELCQCSAVAFFTNRYFDDLLIVDANAAEYRVTTAEPLEPVTGVRRLIVRATNARIGVRLSLEGGGVLSLAEVKAHVRAWFRKAPDLWEASRDMTEWEQLVESAPDMRALLRLLV